jgi:hypothetical protein
MEIGLEINVEEIKRVLLSHYRNAAQNHDINIANRPYGKMTELKYLGTTATIKM